ncbi:MAG: DHH family phosphoesterase [archaeon]
MGNCLQQALSGSGKLNKLISLVSGKKVFLCAHWDADGICSGAIIYHLIKSHAMDIQTLSKGDIFLVTEDDVKGNPDIIISVDIQPSMALDPAKTAYIDHHPKEDSEIYAYSIHDENAKSTTLLIWDELIRHTENPYLIFLVLMGYFGDGGSIDEVPQELRSKAEKLLPDMMVRRPSRFSSGDYYEIERFVSVLNIGKRMFWSGNLPLEMLKDISDHRPFVCGEHPIAKELQKCREELRQIYNMDLSFVSLTDIDYAIIQCDKNVQGVLCARHLQDRPIMILNRFNSNVIGSLRVPAKCKFNAGSFLSYYNSKIESFQGGGHEKAAGFTLADRDLPGFIELLKES